MATRYTAMERRELGEQVVRLSSRGMSNRRIAKALGINPRTVANLQREYLADADPGPEIARVQAIQGHQELVNLCWAKINAAGKLLADGAMVPMISPHGLAGLVNSIQGSLKEIARLRGVEPPERLEISGDLNFTLKEYAVMFASRPREERVEIDEFGIQRPIGHRKLLEEKRREAGNGGKPLMLPPGHPRRRD